MTQTNKTKVLITIISLIFLALLYRTVGTIKLISNGTHTEGTVVGHICGPTSAGTGGGGGTVILCTLHVSYFDKNKKKISSKQIY